MMPQRPSQRDLRRAEQLFAPGMAAASPSLELKRGMQLIEWRPIGKGALIGRAKVRLPNGLEISEIGVFAKEGRIWVQLPSQQHRDAEGRPLTDERGKARYFSPLRWARKELQDRISTKLIEIVRGANPGVFEGSLR